MSDLLSEYKAYYKVRADRFKNNQNYKNSYAAEQDLSNAMQSCSELIEFKDKIGNKNIICGVALTQDKYEMRKKHYEEMKEIVRLEAVNKIIESVPQVETAMDIVTIVSEAENEGSIKISMDEANRQFHGEWFILDRIEIYENAEVPSKYKNKLQKWADDYKQGLIESSESLEENNSHWQDGWKHTPEIVLEHRHKRLLPYKEEHIVEQLDKYRNIINR